MQSCRLGTWFGIGSLSGGLLVAACGDSTGGTVASESTSSTGTSPQTGSSTPTEASGTSSVPTGSDSISDSQASASSSTAATSAAESSTSVTTNGPDTGDTTSPVSLSDSDSSGASTGDSSGSTGDPPEEKLCSADLHAVVNGQGEVLEMCAPTQGCANAMCIDACDAAAQSQANFGCAFIVPTPPAYPPALPPCFAVFLANTVRAHPPELPRTGRSAAIPRKRAFWRGGARPGGTDVARNDPDFGNTLATDLATPGGRRQPGRRRPKRDIIRARKRTSSCPRYAPPRAGCSPSPR